MMTRQQLEETIANLTQVNAALRTESEALRATSEATHSEHVSLHSQYIALAQTINNTITDRDALKQKVLELEAVNKRLTDMLWGRRSERRVDISMSPLFLSDWGVLLLTTCTCCEDGGLLMNCSIINPTSA